MRTRLVFDCPPSLNNCFVNRDDGQGRRKSRRYTAWRKVAAQLIATQPRHHHPGDVVVRYLFRRPNGLSDLGNLEKAASDALVGAAIITDDRRIKGILLGWSEDVDGCEAIVLDCPGPWIEGMLALLAVGGSQAASP